MENLLQQLRKARESTIEAGPFRFTIRRPTDLEAWGMVYDTLQDGVAGVSAFVIDWHEVKESDIVPDGSDKAVPFDPALFSEWVKDMPEIWEPLVQGVLSAHEEHCKRREELEQAGKP